MGFTAGNPIAQSGTDADLSTNAGSVAGASLLATTGGQAFRVFRFDNRLNVTGNLTINGFVEHLIINQADSTSSVQSVSITVSSGGTLTLNGATATIGSYSGDFDPQPVLIFTKRAWFGFSNADAAINISSGGTLTMNNVALNLPSPITVNGTVNINDAVMYFRNDLRNVACIFQLGTGSSGNISNLKLYNGRLDINGNYSGTISGYTPVSSGGVFAVQFASGFTGSYVFQNYNNTFASAARIRFAANQVVELRNNVNGSAIPINFSTAASNGEIVTVTQQLILTAPSIRFFARDYNNGNRQNSTGFGVGAVNFTNDRVYTSLGNATHTILLRVPRHPGSADTLAIDDFRTKGGTNADRFDALYARYDAYPLVVEHVLKGANGLTYTPSLTTDPFITRSTASAATSANTGLTTAGLGLLYDLSKVQKETVGATPATDINPCEYPTLGSLYCDTSLGVELNVNANLSVSTANTAVTFNHTTNTISAPPLATEGSFRSIRLAASKKITFAQAGVYTAVPAFIPATGEVEVTSGITDLSGWTFTSGATIDNTSASAATVYVTASQIANITTGSSGGGAISLLVSPITISGFPTASNSNGVAPAPRVAITNLRTSTTQAYTVSGATISISLSDVGALPTDDVLVTADAIGYIRPLDQTVKGNRTEPISFVFEPWLNAKGQEIVGLASAAAIDFDLVEEQLLLPSGPIDFYSALMRWENVTAGGSFYLFPTDAVRRFDFAEGFDGTKRVVIADNWTVAAKPDDASSPIISDFTVISETVTRDPFEHGLPSTAPGLTDRPEVVIAFQTPGTSITVTEVGTNAITAQSLATSAIEKIRDGSRVPSIQ